MVKNAKFWLERWLGSEFCLQFPCWEAQNVSSQLLAIPVLGESGGIPLTSGATTHRTDTHN